MDQRQKLASDSGIFLDDMDISVTLSSTISCAGIYEKFYSNNVM